MLAHLAQLGIGLGFNSVLLKFSRTDESQADALGSHLMSEAGCDPIEMTRFFEKLSQGGSRGPQFLSDHPNLGNRQKAIEAEIRQLPTRTYRHDTDEFQRIKGMISVLAPPPAETTAGIRARKHRRAVGRIEVGVCIRSKWESTTLLSMSRREVPLGPRPRRARY